MSPSHHVPAGAFAARGCRDAGSFDRLADYLEQTKLLGRAQMDSPAPMMRAIAEFERPLIRERRREGIKLAKKRGVYKGRSRTLSAETVAALVQRREAGEKPSVLAREFETSRMTLHRYRLGTVGGES